MKSLSNMKKLFLILVLAFCLNVQANDKPNTGLQTDFLEWVNWHRAKHNLQPLQFDNVVLFYAERHNKYMIENGQLSHDNFDERLAEVQIESHSINTAEDVIKAKGKTSFVVDNLMKIEEHRANILGDFTHVAISIEKDANGVYYYTQIYVNRNPMQFID